jgi:ABC-type Fe3+/spermidine/putrescine transport system ATPase subunit
LVRDAGTTTIYITHDQHEAFALADQVGVLEAGQLVQMGTPEDIYRDPHDLFVARFTGLAGELSVTVTANGRALGTLAVAPTGLPPRRPIEARIGDPMGAGQRAVLAIRPTAVSLCAHDDPMAHLCAEVSDTAFRGRHYELVVDLGGGRRLAGVVSDRRLAKGTAVGLILDAAGALVFEADPDSPDEDPQCLDRLAPVPPVVQQS